MQIRKIHDGGVLVLTPERLFRDYRGFFLEAHRESDMQRAIGAIGGPLRFVQSNVSRSVPFVLRGMHYQVGPQQGKLMRCVQGKIYQVSVDVRRSSKQFGTWSSVILDDVTNEAVWVPPGFANGFFVFEYGATVQYEMTAYHDAALERSLAWDDPEVGIKWPMKEGAQVILSQKDREAPRLAQIERWS